MEVFYVKKYEKLRKKIVLYLTIPFFYKNLNKGSLPLRLIEKIPYVSNFKTCCYLVTCGGWNDNYPGFIRRGHKTNRIRAIDHRVETPYGRLTTYE